MGRIGSSAISPGANGKHEPSAISKAPNSRVFSYKTHGMKESILSCQSFPKVICQRCARSMRSKISHVTEILCCIDEKFHKNTSFRR